ncbi:retrovirus-related Pol polyprotein from transposon 17.6 [Trichonephila clavipes]|nr:retrovirus-related Pol polyprotein from transposon 17.6 [Trichonephila clavipes]
MPFGLCNAPATFERLMETVLKGLTFEACLIYLDDVIIGGRTLEEHLQNIRKVLSKLSDANLKLNPSKCKFFQKEVNYLGHIISAEGVRTDGPEKVSAVKNWKRPENLRELRSFLGLCTYYRKFVKGFSNIARPLAQANRNDTTDPWSDEKVREDQMADPDIKPLIEFMESSSNKPSWQDISAYSPTTKQYWALWNSLYLRNGVLYQNSNQRMERHSGGN